MLTGVRAVVFDVFGTLAVIGDRLQPYKKIMKLLTEKGHKPGIKSGRTILATNVGLSGIPALFGYSLPSEVLQEAEMALYQEMSSIRLYPETVECLEELRARNYRLALCSNLATPYAVPIRLLLPFRLDAEVWSFSAGAVKPEPDIYRQVETKMGFSGKQLLMVGDTLEADCTGPRKFGWHGYHLNRTGKAIPGHTITNLKDLLRMLP